jgi:AcrR family transcriptional regulator
MTGVMVSDMSRASAIDLYESLFQTAISQVREHGYDAASVSHITRQLGVAKGTFFNYFPTKDHVLSEVFHRLTEDALERAGSARRTGTEAILSFCRHLSDELSKDRVLTEALISRFSVLPTRAGSALGIVRDEERIRSWIEERLEETLPVSVPLADSNPGLLAFLITWAIRGTADEWVRSEAAVDALGAAVSERVGFLLESAGLPTDGTAGRTHP